ncbi:peptidylprolyl isomerase [Orrella sp. 11846]|uniref:peptidylprolyl isomerase n=1 Tax=Orrella sp. 11846 TaxID=3409913 RepID=UPI003B5C11CD
MMTNTLNQARINHVALHAVDELIDQDTLHERAHIEILRQRAVTLGLLTDHQSDVFIEPDPDTQAAIETMLEQEVLTAQASDQEAQRYYEANRQKYVVDQAIHARHILFAVTPGVNVQALANQAESVLMAIQAQQGQPEGLTAFEKAAAQYSNCPSSERGGDLGWLRPDECAPELAKAFFQEASGLLPVGLHQRLIHSRFGLHIVEVLATRPGRQLDFEEVKQQVLLALEQRSRATALRQYMQILVAQTEVEGVTLKGTDTPLVQD